MVIKLKKLDNQKGLISIVVTMIVMSILTLVALGFAGLARREQRQALDQQLSTQAFYAAEAGVNQAIKDIQQGGTTTPNCDDNPETLSADSTVATTCVIVNDQALGSLEYSEISDNDSTLIPIEPTANLNTLVISWQDKAGVKQFAPNCSNSLLNSDAWKTFGGTAEVGTTGLLRAMLIPKEGAPGSSASFANRGELVAKTHTVMLYPSAAGCGNDTVNVVKGGSGPETKGGFVHGNCNLGSSLYCTSKITFDTPLVAGDKYVLRLRGIYRTSSVKITGYGAGASDRVTFSNAQMEIESAGKANDVVRTVKVRVPHRNNEYTGAIFPESTIETENSFCKRLEIRVDGSGNRTVTQSSDSATTSDPACSGPPV